MLAVAVVEQGMPYKVPSVVGVAADTRVVALPQLRLPDPSVVRTLLLYPPVMITLPTGPRLVEAPAMMLPENVEMPQTATLPVTCSPFLTTKSSDVVATPSFPFR